MRYFSSLTVASISLGLNSIIDLSHFSAPQKRLFSDGDWNVLRSKYTTRFSPGIDLNHKIKTKIAEIEIVCITETKLNSSML